MLTFLLYHIYECIIGYWLIVNIFLDIYIDIDMIITDNKKNIYLFNIFILYSDWKL